jgi:hypothetical protein
MISICCNQHDNVNCNLIETFQKVIKAPVPSVEIILIKESNEFIFIMGFCSYVTSSSGPTRRVAPLSFATRILSIILSKFPEKSRAHWFKEHVATVMLRWTFWLDCFGHVGSYGFRQRLQMTHSC